MTLVVNMHRGPDFKAHAKTANGTFWVSLSNGHSEVFILFAETLEHAQAIADVVNKPPTDQVTKEEQTGDNEK